MLEESVRAEAALGDGASALELARALREAEGPSPRALRATAIALRAAGQEEGAREVAARALAAAPEDAELAALLRDLEAPRAEEPPPEGPQRGLLAWLRDRFR